MNSLKWRFVVPAVLSVLLGLRELAAAWMIMFRINDFSGVMSEPVLKTASFEVIFLIPAGLFLIIWPVAYRIQAIGSYRK